ncbi:unnamed protein product [Ixodes hexagonus]
MLGYEVAAGQSHLAIRSFTMFTVLLLLLFVVLPTDACHAPEVPKNGKITVQQPSRVSANQTSDFPAVTTVVYTCDANFELMGPQARHCRNDGTWHPRSLPFCLSDVTGGLPAVQSSVFDVTGEASLAVDGNKSTCASTKVEQSPWLAVDVKDVLPITVVKLCFSDITTPAGVHITVRVGNKSTAYTRNAVCSVFKETPSGQSVYLLCPSVLWGSYISIHLTGTASLSICEFVAYSEARSVEKSAKTVTSRDFDQTPSYAFRGIDNFVFGYSVASILVLVVVLLGFFAYLKRRCVARSSGVAELSVGNDTCEHKVPVERLL